MYVFNNDYGNFLNKKSRSDYSDRDKFVLQLKINLSYRW